MKRWLQNIAWFILPLVATLAITFTIPVSREYAYNFIAKGGCQARPPWIYQQLYMDTTNIDIAFVGTSHTMGAVNDSAIEVLIGNALGKQYNCRNISFCGFGRNFDYLIVKDLLEHKKPKVIVLEVRENESQAGHLSFPYIASTVDVMTAPKFMNTSYVPDLYKALLFRLQYIRECVTHEDERRRMEVSDSRYGFSKLDYTVANPIELDAQLARAIQKDSGKNEKLKQIQEHAPMQYVNGIAMLAAEHNVKLVLLYLPAYSRVVSNAYIKDRYEEYGTIVFPDSAILTDKGNWADNEHLNGTAVIKLSPGIAASITQVLSK